MKLPDEDGNAMHPASQHLLSDDTQSNSSFSFEKAISTQTVEPQGQPFASISCQSLNNELGFSIEREIFNFGADIA
jgi:hypothetical protein